ncbi:hypothetical protein CC78DRAFT_615163 [Lojkania enalia]|uniref:Uncharacterized protein n=1 Tax=Lojkania enalia TaxID=147567 RepID=A0A9P4N5N3_9PLEO|nr:hypothetical protein CC78DRAFT_615163 [Didymosphaeria enalia]
MASSQGSYNQGVHPFLIKEWDKTFLTPRDACQDFFLESPAQAESHAHPNPISKVMRHLDHDGPIWEAELVENFCRGIVLESLNQDFPETRKAAWLDDRSKRLHTSPPPQTPPDQIPSSATSSENGQFSGGGRSRSTQSDSPSESIMSGSGESSSFRIYDSTLTAASLYAHLKEDRIGHAKLPDADRRLIYVEGLDPYYILALVQTVHGYQVYGLRDTLWKYLALECSIKVKMPVNGFHYFQLEFHLPYYALRMSLRDESSSRNFGTPQRQWIDLTFWTQNSSELGDSKTGIHEAQISIVVFGSDETRWTVYGFEDTDLNKDRKSDSNSSDDGDSDDSEDQDMLPYDPIIDAPCDRVNLIWDPRRYYILAINRRLDRVGNEWIELVRKLEGWIQEYTEKYQILPNTPEEMMNVFDWIHKTSSLIHDLKERLSKTIEAWHIFTSPNGDINYFSDLDTRTKRLLLEANESCSKLEGLERNLEHIRRRVNFLEQQCLVSAQMLQLRFALESNKAVQSSGSNSELTVSVISPIAIVSAFFAIPDNIMSFKRNLMSFSISIIFITAVLQLLLFLKGGSLRRFHWWRKITTSKQREQLRGYTPSSILERYYVMDGLRRRSNQRVAPRGGTDGDRTDAIPV